MSKHLVIDANILIRAVLGTRVSALLEAYADSTDVLTVDEAFEDAANYVPGIITKFGDDEKALSAALRKLERLIQHRPARKLSEARSGDA